MAFSDLLTHEAEIWRRDGRTDRFGQAQEPTAPLYTYPARLSGGRGGLAEGERAVDVFIATYRLFLPPDADVREDDLVVVKDKAGNVLLEAARPLLKNDQWDRNKLHHYEIGLQVQRGPT